MHDQRLAPLHFALLELCFIARVHELEGWAGAYWCSRLWSRDVCKALLTSECLMHTIGAHLLCESIVVGNFLKYSHKLRSWAWLLKVTSRTHSKMSYWSSCKVCAISSQSKISIEFREWKLKRRQERDGWTWTMAWKLESVKKWGSVRAPRTFFWGISLVLLQHITQSQGMWWATVFIASALAEEEGPILGVYTGILRSSSHP